MTIVSTQFDQVLSLSWKLCSFLQIIQEENLFLNDNSLISNFCFILISYYDNKICDESSYFYNILILVL